MDVKLSSIKWYAPERVLAAAAVATCLILTTVIWWSISRQQDMWPLPAFYFLEMAAASLVGLGGIYRGDVPGSRLAWAIVGVLAGFSIMGALSVGFFYLPVAALMGLAALWHDRQVWRRLPAHLGLALLAAVAQAALMLVLVRVLYPNAVF